MVVNPGVFLNYVLFRKVAYDEPALESTQKQESVYTDVVACYLDSNNNNNAEEKKKIFNSRIK